MVGPGEDREKNCREDRDDGDDHQQLDECEAAGSGVM
jgi:hypothetical protein